MVLKRQIGLPRPRRGMDEPVWKLVFVLAMAGTTLYQCRQQRTLFQQTHMKIEQHFRDPTPTETEVMRRLSAADFRGKEAIAKQLAGCRVRIIDDEGSLELELNDAAKPAAVEKRIPVEADAADEDGIHVHFLLHVVKGFAKELEVYKDDGTPIRRMPSPNELEIIVLPA
jgi:hypothetical protein